MEGCTPEELEESVAMYCLSDDVPFSWNAGVTGLPVSKAGCSMSGSIVWKFLDTLKGINCELFHSLLWASNLKLEGSDRDLIIWWVILRMELSGNLIQ